MIGAAALSLRKWGREWPSQIAIVVHPSDDISNKCIEAYNLMSSMNLQSPRLGVAILFTPTHWMMSVHTGDHYWGLDGYDTSDTLRDLSKGALDKLVQIGFPRRKIEYPQFWNQKDATSCGWFVLHFLKAILFKEVLHDGSRGTYNPPYKHDWSRFSEQLTRLAGWLLEQHGKAETQMFGEAGQHDVIFDTPESNQSEMPVVKPAPILGVPQSWLQPEVDNLLVHPEAPAAEEHAEAPLPNAEVNAAALQAECNANAEQTEEAEEEVQSNPDEVMDDAESAASMSPETRALVRERMKANGVDIGATLLRTWKIWNSNVSRDITNNCSLLFFMNYKSSPIYSNCDQSDLTLLVL